MYVHLCVSVRLSLCQAPGWAARPPERVMSLGDWAEQGPFIRESGSARKSPAGGAVSSQPQLPPLKLKLSSIRGKGGWGPGKS